MKRLDNVRYAAPIYNIELQVMMYMSCTANDPKNDHHDSAKRMNAERDSAKM